LLTSRAEHLHAALAHGKGVILLSAHFTTLEIGGRLLALHAPFHVMYREHKNALFESVMKRAREEHFEKAIERNDIRGMLRSLKNNRAVWYAPIRTTAANTRCLFRFSACPRRPSPPHRGWRA